MEEIAYQSAGNALPMGIRQRGQSARNGDKNGFVSRLFGFIGKKAGMNQEEIDSAVEEVLKGNSVSFNERFNEIKNRKVVAELFEQMMSWETFTGHNTLKEFFLGDKCYNAQKEDVEAAEKKMEGLSVLHKLLCMVSAMVADADLVDWNYTYSTGKGEKTKAFYKVLELYGFQYPNDEEKGVVEGTSDLYVKKEGAK